MRYRLDTSLPSTVGAAYRPRTRYPWAERGVTWRHQPAATSKRLDPGSSRFYWASSREKRSHEPFHSPFAVCCSFRLRRVADPRRDTFSAVPVCQLLHDLQGFPRDTRGPTSPTPLRLRSAGSQWIRYCLFMLPRKEGLEWMSIMGTEFIYFCFHASYISSHVWNRCLMTESREEVFGGGTSEAMFTLGRFDVDL